MMAYRLKTDGVRVLKVTVNGIFAICPLRLGQCQALAIAAIFGFLPCLSRADDASTQPASVQQDNIELRSEVNQLKTKVDKLEANQAAGQSSPQPGIAPNTNQSSFNAFRFTSGYDPAVGFVLRSDDNQFSLHPGFVFDFRNMTSYREKLVPNSGSEVPKAGYTIENGFDVTRARLTFDGRATENVTYFVQFQADQGTSFGLLDAYWAYHFGKDSPFAIKVGQFKDPIWHERNLSEATLLTVDRSLVEALNGGGQTGRVQGVALMYDRDRLRSQLVFHDGFNSVNTKFFDAGGLGAGVTSGSGVTPTNFGASGRAEFMLIGDPDP